LILTDVVTRDYINAVMKEKKRKSTVYTETPAKPLVLREAAVAGLGPVVTVRDAKSHLSALLEWVSGGREITIMSAGKPKARLVPAAGEPVRKRFRGMGAFLLNQAIHGGASAEELIREDRDSRGW
jgi:prevent-host-death family protein